MARPTNSLSMRSASSSSATGTSRSAEPTRRSSLGSGGHGTRVLRAGTSARSMPKSLSGRRAVDGRQRPEAWARSHSRTRRAKISSRSRTFWPNGSPRVADSFIDSVLERCRQLEQFPELGPVRHDVRPDARCLVHERWLILYRLLPRGVEVVRIADGARDLSALFWPEERP